MANELGPFDYPTASLTTIYFVIRGTGATLVNASTGASMADSDANWSSADIAASDSGHSKAYYANLPSGVAEGEYNLSSWLMAGATADRTVDTMVGSPVTFSVDVDGAIIRGANITHADFEEVDPDATLGENAQTIADAIDVGGVNVTVSAPVDPDDDDRLTLIQGDDHATGDRLPSWTITGYTGPSLASATAVLRLIEIATYRKHGANASAALSVTATVSQASTTVTSTAAITAAQSALLSSYPPGDETTHEYQLVATTSGGAIVTLKLGPVTVRRRINV